MNNQFILAIDGPAGSGKSSIAKRICKLKGWSHLNTGLFYRGIAALAAINKKDINDETQLLSVTDDFLEHANWQNMFEEKLILKRIELFRVLHQPSVSIGASFVAKSKVVRDRLLEPQRIVAKSCKSGGVVIDGRDVGTVVFPNASLKIFLIASIEERTRRRVEQLKSQQVSASVKEKASIEFEEIKSDISKRDLQDQQRAVAPLKKADDAIEIDSSHLSIDQVVSSICSHIVV